MGNKIRKIKNIRIHREGNDQILLGGVAIAAIAMLLWSNFDTKVPFWCFVVVFGVAYTLVLNFYRCPKRFLKVENTEKLVVAPADGKATTSAR